MVILKNYKKLKINLEIRDSYNDDLLFYAILDGNYNVFKLLVEAGVDLTSNRGRGEQTMSPLQLAYAVKEEHSEESDLYEKVYNLLKEKLNENKV